jgi:hypothetical protein
MRLIRYVKSSLMARVPECNDALRMLSAIVLGMLGLLYLPCCSGFLWARKRLRRVVPFFL